MGPFRATRALTKPSARNILLLTLLFVGSAAEAIPAFARRYAVTCTMCHQPAPRLTEFGETFAGNGFEFSPGEPAQQVIETGDPLLRLLDRIDFAVRVDGYAQLNAEPNLEDAAVDLQTPWTVKLLAGGPIADKISFYAYFLVAERGHVAGLEDAYLQFTDLWGSGVSLLVGQFQMSDPLFKRELRLSYADYELYRVRVGAARADLTYDRGLMALWSPWEGADLTLMLVNGRGLDEASGDRRFDPDPWKTLAARYSQSLGPVRMGVFGYLGQEQSAGQQDRIRIFGPDFTVAAGPVELNVQLLRRLDSNPTFTPGPFTATRVDSVLAEVVIGPLGQNERWYLAGLYSLIDANAEVVSLRLGEQLAAPGFLRRYQTASLGVHHLLRRNIRLVAEAGWDLETRRPRLTLGGTAAF